MNGHILIVCTGNVCRSAYVERRLRQALAGTEVTVTSAGTHALVGRGMDPDSAEQLRARGGDDTGFVSRQITEAMVAEADLVIAATRAHRGEVARVNPRGLRIAHAIGDLAQLAQVISHEALDSVADVAAAAAQARGSLPPLSSDESDLVDPFRRPVAVHAQMAASAETSLAPITALLTDVRAGRPRVDG